jgi:hypothetical protein
MNKECPKSARKLLGIPRIFGLLDVLKFSNFVYGICGFFIFWILDLGFFGFLKFCILDFCLVLSYIVLYYPILSCIILYCQSPRIFALGGWDIL